MSKVNAHFREFWVMFHTDAAQAVEEVVVDLIGALGEYNMVTLVGHDFGDPKVVAALYVQPG